MFVGIDNKEETNEIPKIGRGSCRHARRERCCRTGPQGRRHLIRDRSGSIARNSGAQHLSVAPADDRWKESNQHRARRRIGHDDRGSQRAQIAQRSLSRRIGRVYRDAYLARDD